MWLPLAQLPNATPDMLGGWIVALAGMLVIVGSALGIAVAIKTLRATAKGMEPVLKSDLDLAVGNIEQKIQQIAGRVMPTDLLVDRKDFDREVAHFNSEISALRGRNHELSNMLVPVAMLAETLKETREQMTRLQAMMGEQSENAVRIQTIVEQLVGEGVWSPEAVRTRSRGRKEQP